MECVNDMVEKNHSRFDGQSAWRTHTPVFFLFLLSSVAMTWPVVAQLGTAYAGGRDDLWVHQWTFWWIKEALQTGQNPFSTSMLYAPDGVSLLSHNIAWVNIAFWLPLQAVIGSISAYNVMFIMIFTANGFAMYLFSHDLLKHTGAAFVAGVVFGFWPYTMSHYDHPNMILTFALPLALRYLGRLFQQQRWRFAFLTGLFVALLGISRWQLLLMAIPLLACTLLYLFVILPTARTKRSISLLIGAGGIALLMMLPPALPLIQSQLQETANDIAMEEPNDGRTDLLSYFVPPLIYNRLLSEDVLQANPLFDQAYDQIAANVFYMPFIGFTALLLALLGVISQWRSTRFWLVMTLLYILLALGSQLAVNGNIYLAWLPYSFLEETVIGDFIRRPHRFNIILGLPVGVLVGWGTVSLIEKIPARLRTKQAWGITVVLLISLLLFAENRLFGRRDTTPFIVPAWYQTLANDEDNYGLLDLPTNDRVFDKWYMSYQTTHGKPLAVGHVSRMPPTAHDFLNEIPFLSTFLAHEIELDSSIADVSHQLRLLAEGNIRYVVIHKRFISDGYIDRWRDWFTIQPEYEDEELVVFATDPQYGRHFDFEHRLTEDMGLIWATILPNKVVRGNPLKLNTRWGSITAPTAKHEICFDLVDQTVFVPLACRPVSTEWPTDRWLASEVVKADYLLPVPPSIDHGIYEVTAQLADQSGERVGETAVLGAVQIVANNPASTDLLQWQNGMSLAGHTSVIENDTLLLDMYWQSDREVADSFVIFVHLIDNNTGQLAAQSDSIPQNWAYPTMVWMPQETVLEQRSLPLQNVPAGDYSLLIGLYDQVSEERVTTVDQETSTNLGQITIDR